MVNDSENEPNKFMVERMVFLWASFHSIAFDLYSLNHKQRHGYVDL